MSVRVPSAGFGYRCFERGVYGSLGSQAASMTGRSWPILLKNVIGLPSRSEMLTAQDSV
jgi:hypothetical protein